MMRWRGFRENVAAGDIIITDRIDDLLQHMERVCRRKAVRAGFPISATLASIGSKHYQPAFRVEFHYGRASPPVIEPRQHVENAGEAVKDDR